MNQHMATDLVGYTYFSMNKFVSIRRLYVHMFRAVRIWYQYDLCLQF